MAMWDTNWLTVDEAAAELGLKPNYVLWLLRSGRLAGERTDDGWRASPGAVQDRQTKAHGWISYVAAAKIVGCSAATIGNAVKAGKLEHREGTSRYSASIGRASVEKYAEEWQAEQQAAQERRDAQPAVASGFPEDGHMWLDTNTTALVLGISPSRVGQLARRESLPSVTRGRRRWFRRDHIETIAASRSLAATISSRH